ncbi:MAG: lipocalin family protein [Gemmatimonadaceae bacterium]|nr:lipocalin family protein [Gemmatimonadaceae bacterium]
MRTLLRCSAIALSLTACVASTAPTHLSTPPADIVGTWSLKTVNGDSLPYTLSTTLGTTEKWLDEALILNSDGSTVQQGDVSYTSGAAVNTQNYLSAGTFTVTGSNITFEFGGGGSSATGSYSGNTLHMTAQGMALVYLRQ